MIRIITSFIFIVFFLSACISEENKQTIKKNRIDLGNIQINYYSDKSVTSLEIPPDLTSPSYDNSFRLSELAQEIDTKTVNLTNKELESTEKDKILKQIVDIEVKKSGNRRWLVVDKDPDLIWELSKQFLKDNGFVIKKSNKKIGVMETDYLENKAVIPSSSLGFFKSFLSENIKNVSYVLPSVDSYKLRIEPIENYTKAEVHLSLSSMEEVVLSSGISGSKTVESTQWQSKEKDLALETEMLYRLMTYIGGDKAIAREKILNAKETDKIFVQLKDGLNGYAKLTFKLNLINTWDNMAWALSNLNIDMESRDANEKSFYIKAAREADKGIMTRIFGEEGTKKVYRLQLKQINSEFTEVFFIDISEENEKETKDFSYDLFGQILNSFN